MKYIDLEGKLTLKINKASSWSYFVSKIKAYQLLFLNGVSVVAVAVYLGFVSFVLFRETSKFFSLGVLYWKSYPAILTKEKLCKKCCNCKTNYNHNHIYSWCVHFAYCHLLCLMKIMMKLILHFHVNIDNKGREKKEKDASTKMV